MHGRIGDEEVAAIYQRLGMDRPLLVQYFDFLRNALAGDLGMSLIQKAPVATLVLEKLVADAHGCSASARCSRS